MNPTVRTFCHVVGPRFINGLESDFSPPIDVLIMFMNMETVNFSDRLGCARFLKKI